MPLRWLEGYSCRLLFTFEAVKEVRVFFRTDISFEGHLVIRS